MVCQTLAQVPYGPSQGPGIPKQNWPSTAAQMAAIIGYTPSAIWGWQDASGNIDNLLGDSDLDLKATPSVPTYRAITPFAGRYACSFDSTVETVDLDSYDDAEIGTGSLAFLKIIKFTDPGATVFGEGTVIGNGGYAFRVKDGGQLNPFVGDGTSNVQINTTTDPVPIDAYGACAWGVDRNADVLFIGVAFRGHVWSETASTSGLGADLQNPNWPLQWNRQNTAYTHDVLYAAMFEDAQAQWGTTVEHVLKMFYQGR